MSLALYFAQHVSNASTFILRSLVYLYSTIKMMHGPINIR